MSEINVDPEVVQGFASVIDSVYKITDDAQKAINEAIDESRTDGWDDEKAKEVRDQIAKVRGPLMNALNALLDLDEQISIWYERIKKYNEA